MDLQLYLRVLWRFRLLVLSGILLAGALALLSHVRISPEGFTYRQNEEWASYATLLVGGPGLSLLSSVDQDGDVQVQAEGLGAQQAALQRYTALAIIYARLSDSDAVLRKVRQTGPLDGRIEAAALTSSDQNSDALPLISVAAISASPEQARSLAAREVAGLQAYLAERQRAEGVPPERAITFTVVKQPTAAVLLAGRTKTLPIVVFLTVMIAVIALAFVLENLRPRVREVRQELHPAHGDRTVGRRSA